MEKSNINEGNFYINNFFVFIIQVQAAQNTIRLAVMNASFIKEDNNFHPANSLAIYWQFWVIIQHRGRFWVLLVQSDLLNPPHWFLDNFGRIRNSRINHKSLYT